jgi:site-specific recombinase XerD
LHLYYATGIWLVEGVQARVDALRWVSYPDDESDEVISGWEMTVLGKGSKERLVQVPQDMIDELDNYLASLGLDFDPEAIGNRGAYLLGQAVDVASPAPWSPRAQQLLDPKAGISPVTMYEAIKRFFKHCAELLAATDPKGAERLASGSTHWMRHTYGTSAVAAGMPLDVVQQNMSPNNFCGSCLHPDISLVQAYCECCCGMISGYVSRNCCTVNRVIGASGHQ